MTDKLLLAPMAELSHGGLRRIIAGFGGCDLYFSEMISASAYVAGTTFEESYADPEPDPSKLIYQLVGSDAKMLAKAVEKLSAYPVYGFDVNMGCSAPHIVKTGAGISWMKSLDRTRELAATMRAAVTDRSFSVKIRTGYEDNFEYLLDFCKALEAEGVDFITLHGRIKSQKFTRRANWSYITELKKELSIPVMGNGDIVDWDSFEWRRQYGADGYMIGRGAVKRPWLFALLKGKMKDPDFSLKVNLRELSENYVETLEKVQPQEFWATRMRRFLNYFCGNLVFGGHLWGTLQSCEDYSVMKKALLDYFQRNPQEETKVYKA